MYFEGDSQFIDTMEDIILLNKEFLEPDMPHSSYEKESSEKHFSTVGTMVKGTYSEGYFFGSSKEVLEPAIS